MKHEPQWTRRRAIGFLGLGLASASFAKKAIIRTVLADLPPHALAGGSTLFHEHLSASPDFMNRVTAMIGQHSGTAAKGDSPQPAPSTQPFFMQDLDLMTEEVRAAAKDGVACLVDGGHPDMGRSLDFLKQLSMRSGMPIVSATGYYTQPFYPPEIASMSEAEIAEELIHQVSTDPFGAFGEIGTWDEMTPDERKVFRAVGKAHVATNLPIFTHTGLGKGALEQLDVLESVGVQLGQVAIGHLGGLIDPQAQVHKAVCKRGAFVGFDRQGGPGDAAQIPVVKALIDAGYADNLLFASDFSIAAQLKRNGGPGYAKTVTVFAPKLRQAGVSDETIHHILVDNPRRFLAFVPKTPRKVVDRK